MRPTNRPDPHNALPRDNATPMPSRPGRLSLALLALLLLLPVALPSMARAEPTESLDVPKLLLLIKLGYTEAQLKQAVTKSKQAGKFQLQPGHVLQLTKAGFSLPFIKWLGLAKPAAKAAPRREPAKPRPSGASVLPWELRLPPARRASGSKPTARTAPRQRPPARRAVALRRQPPARAPQARQPVVRPRSRAFAPSQPRAARPLPRPPKRYVPPRPIPPSPQVKQLVFALSTSTSVKTRRAAAEQLGKLGPKAMAALPALIKTLQLKDVVGYQTTTKLKQAAIWAIGRMGPYAFNAVVYLFAQLKKPLLKPYAVDALDRITLEASATHGKKLLGFLAQILQRARWVELQIFATRHIGYFGADAAPLVTLLRRALRVRKPATAAQEVRKYAAIALGNIGAKAGPAVLDLARLFNDPVPKQYAREAFAKIIGQSPASAAYLPTIVGDPGMPLAARLVALRRMMASGAIAQLGSPSLLLKAFTPSKANGLSLRFTAAQALGLMGPKALPALPALISALQIKKKAPTSESFRRQLCWTIGKIGPQASAAIGPLLGKMEDFPVVSHAAQRALDQIIQHPSSAWAALANALQSNSGIARIYAARQLMRLKLDPSITATAAQRQKLAALQAKTRTSAAFWSWGAYELAASLARKTQPKAAHKALREAIRMGFDDYLLLATSPLWASLRNQPVYAALIQQMRSSPVDRHELMWHKREQMHIEHDTRMMIIEQMGRKDSLSTRIYRTRIPMRATASHAVLINRLLTQRKQKLQTFRILLADISRRNHVMLMGMYKNMGSGRLSVYARQRAQNAKLMSMSLARQRAMARKRSVQQRQYKQPAGLSSQPSAPPVLKTPPSTGATAHQVAAQYAQTAESYAKARQWSKAEAMATNAIQRQPAWGKAYYIRSTIRSARKNPQGALADINKALQHKPQSFLYWLEKSHVMFTLKRYEQSLQDATKALSFGANHKLAYIAHNNIGAAHLRRGRFQQAYRHFAQAHKLQQYNATVIANVAYVLVRLGRLQMANKWINKALLYDSNNAFGLYTRACLLAAYDRWGVAIEALRNAYANGFDWHEQPAQEPAFAAIKNTPAFRSITGK